MTDRVPTYPGRVRLTPVTGQSNVYDLTREDSPTVIGDALNKANLLPDSVATVLGLTGNPQVKDALALVAAKAPLASPALTGTPTATTATIGTNTTQLATTAFVKAAVDASIVTGAYSGDGDATRTISLGFTPRAVIIYNRNMLTSSGYYYGGIATPSLPAQVLGATPYAVVSVVSGGFQVYNRTSAPLNYTNKIGETYSYIAIK